MLGAGAVDEFARKVADLGARIEHAHTTAAGDVGHVGDLDIVDGTMLHKGFHIRSLDHDGHALLGLADCEFGSVEAGVLGRNAVEIDVQSRGELAYGYAHAAGAEIVGFLDETGDLGAAEKTLELAFLRGISLLDLAAASLERRLGVLLGGASGTSYAVAAGASPEQEDDITGLGALAAHVGSLDGSNHSADLHALGGISLIVDFADVGGGKAYLVAVAGIASGCLAADHALGQLAWDSVRDLGADVAGARHTHGLIDVGTS